MPRTFDFTRSYWGHALHAQTWRQEEPDGLIEKIRDRLARRRRYSALVHVSPYPRPGDRVRYRVEGGIREATIYRVKPCGDPKDMHTLFFAIDKHDDAALMPEADLDSSGNGHVALGCALGAVPAVLVLVFVWWLAWWA